NLEPLELRRIYIDLIQVYKSLFLNSPSPNVLGLEVNLLPITRGHSHRLKRKCVSTSVRKSFFSERVLNCWNSLPQSVFAHGTLSAFKKCIVEYLLREGAHYRPLAACATENK